MKKVDSIQKRVADQILQNAKNVTLGGKKYKVAPPTIGTLVMASQAISELPEFQQIGSEKDALMKLVVSNAKDAAPICTVCAILILGAKKIKKYPLIGAFRQRRLEKRLYMTASPHELMNAIKKTVYGLELSDFFSLTTFLRGINVTEPTKVEDETEAIASGQ